MDSHKKRRWILTAFLFILSVSGFWMLYQSGALPFLKPLAQVSAVNPEFLKMSQIIDLYRNADLGVIVDGIYRKPVETARYAQQYLLHFFEPGMTAEEWIRKHCYRSIKGEIIYFKYPDGATKPMRDVFLEELQKLDPKKNKN